MKVKIVIEFNKEEAQQAVQTFGTTTEFLTTLENQMKSNDCELSQSAYNWLTEWIDDDEVNVFEFQNGDKLELSFSDFYETDKDPCKKDGMYNQQDLVGCVTTYEVEL